ncbi:MAG: hypothetical protein ACXWUG_19825, partial [Polyangiales bacterium]
MQRWLVENGYRLAFRRDGWVECLATRENERWIGRGHDDAEAVTDLLAVMFPSHAARAALEVALAPKPAPIVVPPDPEPPVVAPVVVEPPPPPPPPVEARKEVIVVRREEERATDAATIDEALSALAQLAAEIEDARGDVGKMAPERQRLYLLGWICRARAWEESADGEQAVIAAVARIAKRLSDFAKAWWPGNVRPLQLTARPEDVLPTATVARTWSEAAARVDERLDQLLHEAIAQGLDEGGWRDAERCVPPPPDPTAALERVRAE